MSSFCEEKTSLSNTELNQTYSGTPQGSELLPSTPFGSSDRQNENEFGMLKDSVIKTIIDGYKRSGGKLPNPDVLDAEQYLIQIRSFIVRVKQEYCFYDVRYKYALNELLGAVIQNYMTRTADTQLLITKYQNTTRKLNRTVNDLIQIVNGITNDLMTSSDRFKTEIEEFNKQIQDLKNKLAEQNAIITSNESATKLRKEMVKYTEEKGRYSGNLLKLYSILNIVALGLLVYVYRASN
jgi:methyl-accepting chemotaxis protein